MEGLIYRNLTPLTYFQLWFYQITSMAQLLMPMAIVEMAEITRILHGCTFFLEIIQFWFHTGLKYS